MFVFLHLTTAIFLILFLIWKNSDIPNLSFKTTFFVMFVYGLIMTLQAHGIVINVS